jgi:hypothetical protein
MSPLVKTKRQANFKHFQRFGAFNSRFHRPSLKPWLQLLKS